MKSKSLPIIVIIGALLVGAYFFGIPWYNLRNVVFECQEVYYSYEFGYFSIYYQFVNKGNSDVILSDMKIKIFFKTPENARGLLGSEDFESILQLNSGKMEERHAKIDMHIDEFLSYLESIGYNLDTEEDRMLLIDCKFIIEVSATGRNLSWATQVRYSDSVPYSDV